MDSPSFIQVLKHQRHIVDYTFISASALFVNMFRQVCWLLTQLQLQIYDYLLTLHLEIRLIWFSRWSYTKVLYLLIRYMSFINAPMVILIQTSPNLSKGACELTWHVTIWLLCLQVFLAETALSVRTWAIWSRSKIIGFGLVALNLAHLIIECVFLHKIFSLLQFGVRPYQGFRGCVLTQNSNWEWVNFATVALVEAVVLFLMLISAFRLYREGSQSELTDVIHRDGIIFYVYLLSMLLAQRTRLTLTTPWQFSQLQI